MCTFREYLILKNWERNCIVRTRHACVRLKLWMCRKICDPMIDKCQLSTVWKVQVLGIILFYAFFCQVRPHVGWPRCKLQKRWNVHNFVKKKLTCAWGDAGRNCGRKWESTVNKKKRAFDLLNDKNVIFGENESASVYLHATSLQILVWTEFSKRRFVVFFCMGSAGCVYLSPFTNRSSRRLERSWIALRVVPNSYFLSLR